MHVDIAGRTIPAGVAFLTVRRGRVTTTFVYDATYLADAAGYDLEPSLTRQAGQHYIDGLPGSFSDCAPDRWGRNLLDRRRRGLQQHTSQRLAAATDVDYLLGVSDLTRQGNLRFSIGTNPFLDPEGGVPPLISLPRLLASADAVSEGATTDDLAAVKTLLDAGSASLGGARPKASVRDENGHLLMAKFPHGDDRWDVMAWEKTMLDLAHDAGLRTPEHRLTRVGSRAVLLLERFDRSPGGERRGYISAMTLLGAHDGDERDYADIAQHLPESGEAVQRDLAELFARAVFNVSVHNTDDHLRNHGFLRRRGGWSLSPLFDVNPDPDLNRRRVTSVLGAADAADEVAALPDFALDCRLTPSQAREVIERVVTAVSRWRVAAARNGIPPSELELFHEALETQLAALKHLTRR